METQNTEYEAQLLPTRKFEPRITDSNFPFVCTNNKGTVVVLYEVSRKFKYIVGAFIQHDSSQTHLGPSHGVQWGEVQLYGDGCNVQAALNEDDEIVVVRSCQFRRRCMYRVGKVIIEEKQINWQEENFLTKGVNPTITLSGRTVLFLYEAELVYYRCHYEICKLDDNKIWVPRRSKPHSLPALNGCKEISVAMNKSGQVVFSCRGAYDSNLYYGVGSLDGACLCNVHLEPTPYASGYYSRILLLEHGLVMSVHQSSGLLYKTGHLEGNAIEWGEDEEVGCGYKPSVGVSNNQTLIFVLTDRAGELKYKLGGLSARIRD